MKLSMSDDWLRQQAQRESRIEHHSPRMQWPVKKLLNASPLWNRAQMQKEKKSA